MPDRPDHVLAEIPRAARENLRVMLREKRGQVACELKVAEQDARGVMRETPRGVRVPLVRLADTIAALQAAEHEARRLGLLPDVTPAAGRRKGDYEGGLPLRQGLSTSLHKR